MFACATSFVNVLLGWFSWKIENIMQVHIFFVSMDSIFLTITREEKYCKLLHHA